MKKFSIIFISIIFVFGSCIPASAENNYSYLYEDSSDIDSIKNKILGDLNNSVYSNQDEKLSFDNLDYDGIIKIYIGSDWLKKSDFSLNELNSFMKNSEWFYRLYFYLNNNYIEAVVAKGAELTDESRKEYSNEEIAYLQENVIGKWHIQSYGYGDIGNPNYKQNIENILKKSNMNYSNIYFAAYLSGNIHFAAILVDENSEIKFKILDGYINNSKIDFEYPDDSLYSFEEVKEMAVQNTVPEVDDPLSAEIFGMQTSGTNSNNNKIIIAAVSVGAVLIIAAVTACVMIYKKKQQKKIETE